MSFRDPSPSPFFALVSYFASLPILTISLFTFQVLNAFFAFTCLVSQGIQVNLERTFFHLLFYIISFCFFFRLKWHCEGLVEPKRPLRCNVTRSFFSIYLSWSTRPRRSYSIFCLGISPLPLFTLPVSSPSRPRIFFLSSLSIQFKEFLFDFDLIAPLHIKFASRYIPVWNSHFYYSVSDPFPHKTTITFFDRLCP